MNQIKENMPQNLGVEFAEYLSRKLNKKFECQEIRRIFGGASRETYRVRLIEKNKRDSVNVIYRRSQKNSLIETKQETEYLAYSLFQGTGVPVPKLISFEGSSQSLGAPFLVMEELEGEAASPFDSDVYKPFEEEIGKQFWTILGKIASLEVPKNRLTKSFKSPSNDNTWKNELDYWVGVIRNDSLGIEPILEAAIRWLYRCPPKQAEKICLVHGDYRNGNFLVKKNKITGILDWEMAHLGDPLEDLAWALSPIWCWELLSRPAYLISREKGLAIWKKESGLRIDATSLNWWELFACVKGLAIWISAGNEFISSRNTDPVNLFSAWIPGDIHKEVILDKMEALIYL